VVSIMTRFITRMLTRSVRRQDEPWLARLTAPLRMSLLLVPVLIAACAAPSMDSPLLRAEPAVGAELQRAPRTLRLYFEALPDVSQSSVRLLGVSGEYPLRGLHTMAADDLMIEIMEPLAPGDYTVEWTTVVGADPAIYAGSYDFTVIP